MLRSRTFAAESAVAQMALAELGFLAREIGRQVDCINGVDDGLEYSADALRIMYKNAWEWSQKLDLQTVNAWIAE